MDRLRVMLNEGSNKETELMSQLQEAGFSHSLQSADLVRNVQDLGRIIGKMKDSVGQVLGLRTERSRLLDMEEVSLDAITSGQSLTIAHSDLNEVSRLIGEHKARKIHEKPHPTLTSRDPNRLNST